MKKLFAIGCLVSTIIFCSYRLFAGLNGSSLGGTEDFGAATNGTVSSSRLINTSGPITGGGDLSADRTIGFDGSITFNASGATNLSIGALPSTVLTNISDNIPWHTLTGQGTRVISFSTNATAVGVIFGGTGAKTFTTNGVLIGNSTGPIGVTATGTAGQVLRIPAAGGAPAFSDLIIGNAISWAFDEFDGSVNSGRLGWNPATAGTSTVTADVGTAANPGLKTFTTLVGGTDVCSLKLAASAYLLGGGQWMQEWVMGIPVLSNGTDEYITNFGFSDATTGADATDGVYFQYDRTNSVNWLAVTANNSTLTKLNTGVAASTIAIGGFTKFKIVVNAAGNNADFYISDVLRTNITTNIPIGAGRNTTAGCFMRKTVGTAASTNLYDYFLQQVILTTPR